MLPSKRRLTTEFFEKTIAGRSFHSSVVGIKAILSTEKPAGPSRFAAIASKKNFKTAVSRNSARRRVYAALSFLLPHISDGFFIAVLIKPELMELSMPEMRSALGNILERAGIMKKEFNKVQ